MWAAQKAARFILEVVGSLLWVVGCRVGVGFLDGYDAKGRVSKITRVCPV